MRAAESNCVLLVMSQPGFRLPRPQCPPIASDTRRGGSSTIHLRKRRPLEERPGCPAFPPPSEQVSQTHRANRSNERGDNPARTPTRKIENLKARGRTTHTLSPPSRNVRAFSLYPCSIPAVNSGLREPVHSVKPFGMERPDAINSRTTAEREHPPRFTAKSSNSFTISGVIGIFTI